MDRYRQPLGPHYPRYGGHVYRVYHYTRHLIARGGVDPSNDDTAIALAAAFHDLRFATNQTLDYLPPSIDAAAKHIEYDRRGSIGFVKFNRPEKRNAFTIDMFRRIAWV